MAMDALQNLVNSVPDWLTRLDDLSGEIEKRQAELAAPAEGKSPETKSLRNKGSTESLKPKDEPPVHAEAPTNEGMPEDATAEDATPTTVKPPANQKVHTPSAGAKRKQDENDGGMKYRKKSMPPSKMSDEDAPTTYRTGRMIVVYYDSYVQNFFGELSSFVSSIGNLIRKAKIAAKIAPIKQDVSDDDNDDALPSLPYRSSRRSGLMMSTARPGAGDQPLGVYDTLGKDLEFVQSMCEHGAHRFLRDGDCNDEITEARNRLEKVYTTTHPHASQNAWPRGRQPNTPKENKLEPAMLEAAEPTPAPDSTAPLAVDPDPIEADEGPQASISINQGHEES